MLGAAKTPSALDGGLVLTVAGREDGPGDLLDRDGSLAGKLCAEPGAVYLARPDHHIAARWRTFNPGEAAQALSITSGRAVVAAAALEAAK